MNRKLRLLLAVFLSVALLLTTFGEVNTGSAVELTNEQIIWYFLKDEGLSDCGVAGLMGNLFAESGLKPTNLQDSFEKKLGYNDSEYTSVVDNGSYSAYSFAHDSAGYGLAQWTYWSRKEGLYNYAASVNASIGDLDMQLAYLVIELKSDFSSVWNTLKSATTVREASNKVLFDFEQPANQDSTVQDERTNYGFTYYNKYAGTTRPVDSSEETSEAPAVILGDANGDGMITSSDSITVQAAVSGSIQLTDEQRIAADVTNDGSITASDYISIVMYLTKGTPF